jgi:hypothetical protein
MLKPVAAEYLERRYESKPGDRLHRLIARLCDTYYDDLSDERIEQLERQVDEWRWMHADATRFTA